MGSTMTETETFHGNELIQKYKRKLETIHGFVLS